MKRIDSTERIRSWIVDYSAARAKAIEWLGDRYLLAKPINRMSAARHANGGPRQATAADLFLEPQLENGGVLHDFVEAVR